MARRRARVIRFFSRTLPILAAIILLLAALYLVSDVQRGSEEFGNLYYWVFAFAGVALLVLIFSITHRIVQLVQRVRQGAPGARLSARMVRMFLVLALPPALIVYLFSIEFLDDTVNGWFDVEVESALEDSIEVGRLFLDQRTLQVRNQMLRLGEDISDLNSQALEDELWRRVSSAGPVELSVITGTGRVRANANINPREMASRPDDFALLQASQRGEYAVVEPGQDNSRKIRVLIQIADDSGLGDDRFLQAIYPLPANLTAMAQNIETEYNRYQRVSYLRSSLTRSFVLILTLVLVITVLLAILAAILAARRLVKPIGQMADATEALAMGDFSREVSVSSKDELGFLLSSFNLMTRKLEEASVTAETSRLQSQRQKDYLEAVLGRLSAGVMTFNGRGQLITVNASSAKLLGIDLTPAVGQTATELASKHSFLTPLMDRLNRELEREGLPWRREIKLSLPQGLPLVLMCSGSSLARVNMDTQSPDEGAGHVLVFDDATVLNEAQREAAWSEVARRLAHEVKNPLTPIRLSAERLQLKLSEKLSETDSAMLQRSTNTIINQVDALKSLVNAFGDYAQEPAVNPSPIAINQLVEEVAELYRNPTHAYKLALDLTPANPAINADGGQLRQLLHNLIQNAEAAVTDVETPAIRITTRPVTANPTPWIELEIADNGPGLAPEVAKAPFEPYLTTKPGGSGLGLAICRKIVQQHGGEIEIHSVETGGVRVSVRLPALA